MEKLPTKYMKLINQYKPIEIDGFTLYPMTVENYEDYLIASQSIGYMQQSMPIQLMSIPILSAFFKIDCDRAMQQETPTGLYTSALIALVLALRLNKDGEDIFDTCRQFTPIADADDPTMLKALVFDLHGDNPLVITPVQFGRLRPIIAAQNGIEIPDELDNPELVQAERDLAEKKAPKLDTEVVDLISSAAAITGKDEEEIYGWAVLKLTRRLDSFRRIIDYMICAISEGNGSTYKSGNPCPHPYFKRLKEGSDALISMDRFAGGQGKKSNAGCRSYLDTNSLSEKIEGVINTYDYIY